MMKTLSLFIVLTIAASFFPAKAFRSQDHEAYLLNLVGREALMERAMSMSRNTRGHNDEVDRNKPSAEIYLRDSYIQKIIDEGVQDIPEVQRLQLHFTENKLVVDTQIKVVLDAEMDISLEIPFTFEGSLKVAKSGENRLYFDVLTLKVWEGNLPAETLLNVGLKLLAKSPQIGRYITMAMISSKPEGVEARIVMDVNMSNIMDFTPQPVTITLPNGKTHTYTPSGIPVNIPEMKIGYVSSRNGMLGMSLY